MKLSFQESIAVPRGQAFRALTDFDTLLPGFLPSGADLQRLDAPGPVHVGSAWQTVVVLHGLERVLTARLEALMPQEGFALRGEVDELSAHLDVALSADGTEATRAMVDLRLAPKGLAGRLMIKPIRLVRGQIAQKLAARLARYARQIEAQGA